MPTFSRRGRLLRQPSTPAPSAHPRRAFLFQTLCGETFSAGANNQCFTITFFGHFSAQIPQPLQVSRINLCEEVRHFRCANRAVSLTECTADTTCAALLHRHRTFCLGATCHQILCIVRNQRNQVLRTCCDTFSTCLAGFLIDNCYAVYDMDCVEGTCLYAVTETGTTIITGFRPPFGTKESIAQSAIP